MENSPNKSDFVIFCDQQALFKNALIKYDPTVWFPPLRGKHQEEVPSNWFICFVPAAWGHWKKANYGIHFDLIYARANSKLPKRFRLVIGVESPLKEHYKQAFKEEVISRISSQKIDHSGFTLTAMPRKKLLEADPVSFDSESWKKILQKYIMLHPIIDTIGLVSREYSEKGAFYSLIRF